MGGREVHVLLQFSERRPCHIWLAGRMFASLEANLGLGWGLLGYHFLLFFYLLPCVTFLLIGLLNDKIESLD